MRILPPFDKLRVRWEGVAQDEAVVAQEMRQVWIVTGEVRPFTSAFLAIFAKVKIQSY